MTSKGSAIISALLACLALVALASGQWITRPASLDLWGSVLAVGVICAIVAGGPQVLIFVAAVSCTREGRIPASGWWTTAYAVFVLQFGAGAAFVVGAIVGEEILFSTAAAILAIAALVAVASALVVSRVASNRSEQARDA
jgi:hypothetical protein